LAATARNDVWRLVSDASRVVRWRTCGAAELGSAAGRQARHIRYRRPSSSSRQSTGRLEELVLRDSNTVETRTVPAAALFVLIGAQPHTAWLPESIQRDQHGFVLTGTDVIPASTAAAGGGEPRPPP
jgi:thioredoxin reductase